MLWLNKTLLFKQTWANMEGVSCQSLSEAVDSYTLMSHAATPTYYTVQYTLSQCTLSCHFHIKFGVILPYFTRYRMAACLSMCDMKKCVCVSLAVLGDKVHGALFVT